MDILHHAFVQLGLDHFSLVGLSIGGGLGIEYASLHPDNVRTMVLFEPGGLGEKVDFEFITWLYIKIPGMLRFFSRNYIRKNNDAIRKSLESLYVGGSKPTDPDRLISILKDEVKGKYDHGEKDMDDWQLRLSDLFGQNGTFLTISYSSALNIKAVLYLSQPSRKTSAVQYLSGYGIGTP